MNNASDSMHAGPRDPLVILERVLSCVVLLSLISPLSLWVFNSPVRIHSFDAPLLILLITWGTRLLFRNGRVRLKPVDFLFALLLTWFWTTSFAGRSPVFGVDETLLWTRSFLLYFYFRNNIGNTIRVRDLSTMVWILLLVQCAVGIVQLVSGTNIGALNKYFGATGEEHDVLNTISIAGQTVLRIQGTVPSPHILAAWMIMLLPAIQLKTLSSKNNIYKICYSFSWILFVFVLLFTFSRKGWIAMVIGFVLSMIFWFRHNKINLTTIVRFLTLCVFFGIAICSLMYDNPAALRKLHKRLTNWETYGVHERMAKLRMTNRMIMDNPWTGVGFRNYAKAVKDYSDPYYDRGPGRIHNIPLLLTAETGLIGGVMFLLLMISLWRGVFPTPRDLPFGKRLLVIAIFSGVTSYLVMFPLFGLDFDSETIKGLLFILLGAGAGLNGDESHDEKKAVHST